MPFSLEQMDRQYRAGGVTVALGLPVDRLHRGLLRGRRHRDQQRALPPPAGRGRSTAGAGPRHRSTSTPTSSTAICDEVEQALSRPDRARRTRRRPARCCAAARSALGWRHDEIPRWMTYPPAATPVDGRRQSMTRDLPAPRPGGRGAAARRLPRRSAGHRRRPGRRAPSCRRTGRRPARGIGRVPPRLRLRRRDPDAGPAAALRAAPAHRPLARRAPDGQARRPLRRRGERRRRRAGAPGEGVRPRPVVRRVGEPARAGRAGAQRPVATASAPAITDWQQHAPSTTRRSPARAGAGCRRCPACAIRSSPTGSPAATGTSSARASPAWRC